MPFQPVSLATDVLVWLLVAAAAGYAWYCARRPHLAAPWRRVFQSKAALASSVVLVAYLAVGLADSLHFRQRLQASGDAVAYSPEVLSVLDLALAHLRERREKSYSAPLATHLYTKEQIELGEGKQARDFPRLRHGGAHLSDPTQAASDIALLTLRGLLGAAVL